MPNIIRTTLTLTLSFDVPAGPDRDSRLLLLDDMLVAAERAIVKEAAAASDSRNIAGVTRVRISADIDDAVSDIF